MIKRVLITGSNRGLGLEFVRQYCEDGWRVYAACRHPTDALELQQLAQIFSELSLHRLDITIPEDVARLRAELAEIPLNLLISNAGVSLDGEQVGLGSIHYDDWERTLEINTLGTVRVIEALVGNLTLADESPVLAIVSGPTPGAESRITPVRLYHDSSKAALNHAMKVLKSELGRLNIGVLLLDPGQVMTRSGTAEGISSRLSVAGMREVIADFRPEQSGEVIRYDGTSCELQGDFSAKNGFDH